MAGFRLEGSTALLLSTSDTLYYMPSAFLLTDNSSFDLDTVITAFESIRRGTQPTVVARTVTGVETSEHPTTTTNTALEACNPPVLMNEGRRGRLRRCPSFDDLTRIVEEEVCEACHDDSIEPIGFCKNKRRLHCGSPKHRQFPSADLL